MKKMLMLLLVMTSIALQAQIPAQVKDILQKCSDKMDNPAGIEMDLKLHLGMVVMSFNGSIKMCEKGDKSFSIVSVKAMGKEMYTEQGYDGTQEWEFTKATGKEERDSLIITKKTKKSKGEYDVDLDFDKEYSKAKLKETSKFWEITFTEPKDKDAPKKTTVKIVKNTYMLHEIEAKQSIATMRMTVTKMKVGVSDDVFKLDMQKFPNAVVVRK